jgi:hypothetical protein
MAQSEAPIMTLVSVGDGRGPWCGESWRAGLAPEVETVDLVADQEPPGLEQGAAAGRLLPLCLSLLGDRPYAVCGYGAWALAALELTRLLAAKRPPAHLLVADCPAPQLAALAAEGQVGWPVTAFSEAGPGGQMTRWRHITTGSFTLRLVPADQGLVSASTLLAVKEELRVWPA